MDSFGNDLLALVLERVSDRRDRRSCSEVCKQWFRSEGRTRSSLRILEPESIPDFLPRFPNLTTLEIGNRISDQNLEFIAAACPNLQILNLTLARSQWLECLEPADFGYHGLIAIAVKCRHLVKVSLKRRETIGDFGVQTLIGNSENLAVLDLSWCSRITDESLEAMSNMSSLTELYLQGCSLITDYGLLALANGSPEKTLRVLDLAECDQITDRGLLFLQHMVCLEELSLADCGPGITDSGGIAISAFSSIRRLDLSWLINLSDLTLFLVARNCRSLVEISLRGCEEITGAGIRSFAGHGALEVLDLTRCYAIGVDDLENMVLECKSLRHLVLDKALSGWISPSMKEELSRLCRVYWM